MARSFFHSRILAVFAHPDDETPAAPLLAKCAAEGCDVFLALVTSGQKGNANTSIPPGEELGAVREQEARCAAAALGIHEPIFLRFMDGELSQPAVAPAIVARLRQLFDDLRPQDVITWGPDGGSGHPDHRAVSNLVTQVFQNQSVLQSPPQRLFYVAFPESLFRHPKLPALFRQAPLSPGMADQFVTAVIDGSAYAGAAVRAIRCHQTQWNPARMEEFITFICEVCQGKVYLRQAFP